MTTPLPEPEELGWDFDNMWDGVLAYGYTAEQLKAYGKMEYYRALAEANVLQSADWMDEAAEDIEFWGTAVHEYFQKKYNLAGYLKDYRERAVALRKLGEIK